PTEKSGLAPRVKKPRQCGAFHQSAASDQRSSAIAHLFLLEFPTLLSVEAERGDRPGFQAGQADFLAGFFAVAVGTVFDSGQGLVDLVEQLAVAIAGAKFQ